MQKLTEDDVVRETGEGTGFCWFMGGWHSRNGKEILVVNGEHFLFEQDEVNGEEWKAKVAEQNQEAKEFYELFEKMYD